MGFERPYFFCFLLVLLQLPFFTTAHSNISFGSLLTAHEHSKPWTSPSGDFAFGFRKVGNAGYLLAIWFNKIHKKTIVWSANRNSLVQQGSRVEFSLEGTLTLTDIATRKRINIADDQSMDSGVAYAAMLDTGNFVLATRDSAYLWQSFDHPTDTILPTQTLHLKSSLFAQLTATNYSEGRFKLILESRGDLRLYTTNYPSKSTNFPYLSIETGSGFQVIFNQSGSIYLAARNGSILRMVLSAQVSTQDIYQRATLGYDGVLRHYFFKKGKHNSGYWSVSNITPPNICTAIVESTGGGACGFNSLCKHEHSSTICSCPPSYIHVDPDDERKGCKQNFVPQGCDKASSETDLFEFQEIPHTDWPGGDYQHLYPVNKEQCKQSCIADCFCATVIFSEGNNDCYKKGLPLSNGKINNSEWLALVKVRKETSTLTAARERYNITLYLVGAVIILVLTNLVVSIVTYLVSSRSHAKVNQNCHVVQAINLKCFTFIELKEATNGFKEELGRGAFATVFKGVLASNGGKFIAVKRLNAVVKENDLEFKAEVTAIGGTNHRNLVQLLGFCNEGKHQLLVYEFMSNGSLASFLFGKIRPNWYQRKHIALGTARGILYLHEECTSQIIHCDIKPQNILLDDTCTARIADFGVAKLLKCEQSRTTTRIRGTKGYVAPEWFKNVPVTVKVDVYSYGIVLLEIVCCRKSYEAEAAAEDEMILADWAYYCYKEKKLHLLLQNVGDEEARDGMKELEKYLMIAFWCIQEDPSVRPTMKKVTQMLEGTVEVSEPPNPSSIFVKFM